MAGDAPSGAETLNGLWSRALVEELVRSGLRHAVICPGSRSTPIALALADAKEVRTWSVVDERSAAFFALGIAKQSGTAAVVLATSGSAGAHFYPAVIEAAMAHVPLVLITADRPPELHGWGAQQSIDQQRLFGGYARQFSDLGVPEARSESLLHLRATVDQACAVAHAAPRGPVHLNAPFREPLAPDPAAPPLPPLSARALRGEATPLVRLNTSWGTPHPGGFAELEEQVASVEHGVIVVGPRDADDQLGDAISLLGRRLGYPIFAEATSNVRFGHLDDVSAVYDALIRSPSFAQAHLPKLVLRFGGAVTSKTVQAYLDASSARTFQFSDGGALHDPQHVGSAVLIGDPSMACALLTRQTSRRSAWRFGFDEAERRVRQAFAAEFESSKQLTEPSVAYEVARALPAGAQLFVSSSMPIRDLDAFAFAGAAVRTLANRGANGIDGIVSSALGVSAAAGKPTVLLTGDLALLHDLSGSLIARRHSLPLTIVVVNNDGGGIFSFLPVASRTEHFEALFGTPHGIELERVAALSGARYARCEHPEALRRELARSVEGGLNLLEIRTDRRANVAEHRRLFALASAALGEGPWA